MWPLTVDEMSSIVTDADINNAITLILGESESRGGDNTEAVSEEARGSLHVAYWGVIAAAEDCFERKSGTPETYVHQMLRDPSEERSVGSDVERPQ